MIAYFSEANSVQHFELHGMHFSEHGCQIHDISEAHIF